MAFTKNFILTVLLVMVVAAASWYPTTSVAAALTVQKRHHDDAKTTTNKKIPSSIYGGLLSRDIRVDGSSTDDDTPRNFYHGLLDKMAESAQHRENIDAVLGGSTHETKKCQTCLYIAQIFVDAIENPTLMNDTEKLVDFVCELALKKKITDERKCLFIANGIIGFFMWGGKKMKHWQVNVAEIACADALPLCVRRCCSTPYNPTQLRLSIAGHDAIAPSNNYTVSWITLNTTNESCAWHRVAGSNNNWTKTCAAGQAAQRTYYHGGWRGCIHGVTMRGLEAGTTYEYKVGSEVHAAVSRVVNFTTIALGAGQSKDAPLKVLALADMGWGPNSDATIADLTRLVDANAVHLLIHPGDIGYADGDQHWEDLWGHKIEPVASRVPYMTVQGNHEQIWWNATAYKKRWWMPPAGNGAPSDATYYSFSAGPVQFFMVDTETVINTPDVDAAQRRWMDSEMRRHKGEDRLYFVAHHRPMYCSSYDKVDCTTNSVTLRNMVEDIYEEHGVAAVMVGHVHNYERTFPVYKGTVASTNYTLPTAPTYFVNGAPGNREGQAKFYTDSNPWSAKRTMQRGYMMLEFYRTTAEATTKAVAMNAKFILSGNSTVFDEITLVKGV